MQYNAMHKFVGIHVLDNSDNWTPDWLHDVHDCTVCVMCNILVSCSQLFGEADADEEVSPDTEDPEAVGGAGEKAIQNEEKENAVGGIERTSTRTWAEDIGYDPVKLFNKVTYELVLVVSSKI